MTALPFTLVVIGPPVNGRILSGVWGWAVIWVALLLAQQVLTPPASLHVACQGGHWQQVAVTGKTVSGKCVPLPPPPEPGHADVVGHADVTVEAFEAVNMTAAQALRVMSVDRSVGWNISEGLISCLPYADPPSFCCRWAWDDGSYPSPPMDWTAHPLPQWQYYTWPGQNPPTLPCPDTSSFTACFESYLATHAADWDVVSLQPDYLTAGSYQLQAEDYLASYERIRAAHPNLQVILHTASLARTVGTAANAAFNDAVRAYVQTQGGLLLDVADIETYDPYGQPWFYNGFPVIAPHYTSELSGGHLGSPSAGMIRLAMAWWITLGRITGQ